MVTNLPYGKKEEIREIVDVILSEKLGHMKGNCPADITDCVFLEIENDADLMRQYNEIRNEIGAPTVNALIGKIIKETWDLKDTGRCKVPKSRLIGSYEMH